MSDERRQQIVDAARQLYEEQGLSATAVKDISERCGVARSLFYHYFRNKQEVTSAVIDDFVKKGQITVEQGKNLNSELTRKVKETFDATVSGASDSVLRSKLESMTPEQRAEYAKKVADMSAAIDAEGAGAAEDAVAEDASDAAEDVVEPDVAE